jgi:hypothetical protein
MTAEVAMIPQLALTPEQQDSYAQMHQVPGDAARCATQHLAIKSDDVSLFTARTALDTVMLNCELAVQVLGRSSWPPRVPA